MITNISIKKIDRQTRLKAIANIVIDHVFAIHDIKIIDGEDKIFMGMPSRKIKDERWVDICHPICQEYRIVLENIILSCTEKAFCYNQKVVNFTSKYKDIPLLEQKPEEFEIDIKK